LVERLAAGPIGRLAQRSAAGRPGQITDANGDVDLFHRASPSVVFITSLSVRRNAFRLNLMQIPRAVARVFIWDEQGHVVTNFHVIQGGDARGSRSPTIDLDATLVGAAPEKDLAVLKIEAPVDRLQPIPSAERAICSSASRCTPSATRSVSTIR
jgi:S1-C subfamily serine protease